MKNLTKLFAFTVVMLGLYSSSFAQQDPFATAIATGTIAAGSGTGGSTLTKNEDLQFGNISTTGTAGTVNQPATAAGGSYNNVGGSGAKAAMFTLTSGDSETHYGVTITDLPAFVTNTTGSGNERMALSGFVNNLTSLPLGVTTNTSGGAVIYIGAVLTVGTTEVAGIYESTAFKVTVNMQ